MNILGLYGAIGWNILLSNDKKTLQEANDTWTHGASVTLIKDGEHCVSISEERLSKIKYDGNFPRKSIEYCLSAGNLDKNDIDLVVVPSMANRLFYQNYMNKTFDRKIKRYFPNAKIELISHHLSHAYSSVFSCDYNDGSFITVDNAGSAIFDSKGDVFACENHSFGYFNKKKNIFKYYPGIPQTNNLGSYYWLWAYHIYTNKIKKNINITDPFYRETFCGKIMGLSAYGTLRNPNKDWKMHFESIPQVNLLSYPEPKRMNSYERLIPEDKAKQLQYNFENAILSWMKDLKRHSYIENNLCLAGGVFLNILANSVLRKNNVVENMHIPPFPDDTGLSFGAAMYGLFKNNEQINLPKNISLLGKDYSDKEIESVLTNKNYKKYDNFEELCEVVSKHLAENKIVGWFQNRSEFGPRALGSRSILMNPKHKKNKDIMNSRIKHREEWRPFAGIILDEYVEEYFENSYPNTYMLYSLVVKPNKRNKLGAITHVDYSCRIQTVNKDFHPEVTKLLHKYNEETGCPVLLNTSFNDNGQPIIETPKDAIDTFNKIDLDYLCIGNYLVTK